MDARWLLISIVVLGCQERDRDGENRVTLYEVNSLQTAVTQQQAQEGHEVETPASEPLVVPPSTSGFDGAVATDEVEEIFHPSGLCGSSAVAGGPDPFDGSGIHKALLSVRSSCKMKSESGVSGTIAISFSGSGKVDDISMSGYSLVAEACIRHHVAGVRVPPFNMTCKQVETGPREVIASVAASNPRERAAPAAGPNFDRLQRQQTRSAKRESRRP
jgi:hypothetical protein